MWTVPPEATAVTPPCTVLKALVPTKAVLPPVSGDRCAERVAGISRVDVDDCVGAASTLKVAAFDVPPPGAGLTTVTEKLPVVAKSLAGIVTVSSRRRPRSSPARWNSSGQPTHRRSSSR